MASAPVTEPSDEVLDAVAAALSPEFEAPSRIARRAKVSTSQAHEALRWLRRNQMLMAAGNGCWTKYRVRQFGEIPR